MRRNEGSCTRVNERHNEMIRLQDLYGDGWANQNVIECVHRGEFSPCYILLLS